MTPANAIFIQMFVTMTAFGVWGCLFRLSQILTELRKRS